MRMFYIGDKVSTVYGIGYISDVKEWRDVIVDMSDDEAVSFASDCKRKMGIDYRDKWCELSVDIEGRKYTVQAYEAVLVESRTKIDKHRRL